jgi:hypothetical protein
MYLVFARMSRIFRAFPFALIFSIHSIKKRRKALRAMGIPIHPEDFYTDPCSF